MVMRITRFFVSGLLAMCSLAVTPQSAGTIGPGEQTICYQSAPVILRFTTQPTGGTEPYAFSWERSNDGVNFKPIAGTVSQNKNYSPPVLGSSAWFRCRVTDANSQLIGITNTVVVWVRTNQTAGIIGTSQTINYGATPLPLREITPPTGGGESFSYRWQSSEDGLSWSNIPDANSSDYYPSRLFTTTSFRRWTIDPVCRSLTGNMVTITVNPSIHHYDFTYPDRSSLLADGWDFMAREADGGERDTEVTSGEAVISFDQSIHPGVIRIPVDEGEVWEWSNDSRNTLFRDLPDGWTSVRVKIESFEPTVEMPLAGMLVYQDDDNYVQINKRRNYGSHLVLIHEQEGDGEVLQVIPAIPGNSLWLRLDYNSEMGTFFGYYSTDGTHWRYAGSVEQTLTNPRLAIYTGGSPEGYHNADFAWAEISFEPLDPPIESLSVHPTSLVFNAVEGQPMTETRSLFISTLLGRNVSWSRSVTGLWLTTDISGGTTDGVLKASVNTSGLSAGTYQGSIILSSSQVTGAPVTIPVTLVVNPAGVRAATWLDGKSGAFSVSVDDGFTSGSTELAQHGLAGTYVYIGDRAPVAYQALYNMGMELGCHTTNSLPSAHPDNAVFRSEEIEPNIDGLAWLMPVSDVISFVWPFGGTNQRLQAVVADYFLSSRGYNINQLEDATPENFMNLKSFNSIGDPTPPPTEDFSSLVDAAVAQGKWFNMVLHAGTDQPYIDAINHAATLNTVWTAPIGTVIKYIMQRERLVVTEYDATTDQHAITFRVSRLEIPGSSYRSFETAFKETDVTTLDIDIDPSRIVDWIYINGDPAAFTRIDNDDNTSVIRVNVLLEPGTAKSVQIQYYDPTLTRLFLSENVLNFLAAGDEIDDQQILLTIANPPDTFDWTIPTTNVPAWLQVSPMTGEGDETLVVSIDDSGLENGDYSGQFQVVLPEAVNSPVTVTVNLTVRKPRLSVEPSFLNFIAELNGPPPQGIVLSLSNSGSDADLSWNCSENIPWLGITSQSGTTPDEITVTIDNTGLVEGIYRGVLTFSAQYATNSPLEIPVSLRVHDGVLHYDFTYPDRTSLFADGWDFIARPPGGGERNTEITSGDAVVSYNQSIHPGIIRIPVDDGDVWEWSNNSRNTLFHDLPEGWTSVRLKIESFEPDQDLQMAGLLIYQDDDNYIQIAKRHNYNAQIVFLHETDGDGTYYRGIPRIPSGNIYFRIDNNTALGIYLGYYSFDGVSWRFAGSSSQSLTNPRMAILTGTSPGGYPNADIAWAEISFEPLDLSVESLSVHPTSLVFNTIEGQPMTETRSLFISTLLGRNVSWSRSVTGLWLTTDISGGTTDGVLKASVNTSGLSAGTYQGSIILSSSQVTGAPVTIPVTLVVNPAGVRAATWLDGKSGAFSVSVDDGFTSGSTELAQHGLAGTYVYIGDRAPVAYQALYNMGMELGCHTTNSLPSAHPDNAVFRSEEIEPNIDGLAWLMPVSDVISFVWPFGGTNQRLQAVVADYFLSSRGYNINQLEDATPENFMNLKSFNSIGDPTPPPTEDFSSLVDAAVAQGKWFNMVLHAGTDQPYIDAINHAATLNTVWTAPIGTVIKYIMQRERLVVTEYDATTDQHAITFRVSRLEIPGSSYRSFETAFKETDVTTLDIDIDPSRIVDWVYINGDPAAFTRIDNNDNTSIIRINVLLEPGIDKGVEISYYVEDQSPDGQNSEFRKMNTLNGDDTNPANASLSPNYPNPFTNNTTLDFVLKEDSFVTIEIFSSSGRKVETLVNRELPAGEYSVRWDAAGLPTGIYYASMTAGNFSSVITMMLTK